MVCGSGGSHNGSRWNGLVGEVEGERSERAWKGVVRGRRQGRGRKVEVADTRRGRINTYLA